MENSEIIAKVFELKEKIIKSYLYKDLKEKEKKMMEDDECSKLLCQYQNIQSKYNEAKRFEKYGSDIVTVSKELSEIKCKVNENKLVKEYNEAFRKMNKQLKNIEKIIFKDITKERKEIELE